MTGKWGQIQGSLQSRSNFGEQELSISLILMKVEGWGEKEIFTNGAVDDKK